MSISDAARMQSEKDPDLQALITLGLVEAVEVDGRTEYQLSTALAAPDYTPNAALVKRLQANRAKRSGDTPVSPQGRYRSRSR